MKYFKNLLNPEVELRLYTADDQNGLIQTINAVCAEDRWMHTLRYEPTPAWEHALAEPNCNCHLLLVVAQGLEIIGWSRIFPEAERQSGEIGLALRPILRGQGIGTWMLEQSLEWACERAFQEVTAWIQPDNGRIFHILTKHGFLKTGKEVSGLVKLVRNLR